MSTDPTPADGGMAEVSPPRDADPAPAARRKATEPVTTLSGYFARKTYRPQRFLADLTAANVWQFGEEDVATALTSSADADPRFTRTVALAATALQAEDIRFRRPLLEFAWRSALLRLQANPRYVRAPAPDGDVAERLHTIARALEPRLRESRHRVESLNLLMASALWLHHSEGLSLEPITEEAVAAVRSIPRIRRRSEHQLVGYLADQARSGPKGILPVVGTVEPWIQRARETARRAVAEQERADAESAAHERLRENLSRAEAENARLTAALESARREVAEMRTELEAARIHFEHGSGRLRSQIAAALSGRLHDLVATAQEALTMDQPRVHVAQEKLDVAVEELEKQAEWLRSSD